MFRPPKQDSSEEYNLQKCHNPPTQLQFSTLTAFQSFFFFLFWKLFLPPTSPYLSPLHSPNHLPEKTMNVCDNQKPSERHLSPVLPSLSWECWHEERFVPNFSSLHLGDECNQETLQQGAGNNVGSPKHSLVAHFLIGPVALLSLMQPLLPPSGAPTLHSSLPSSLVRTPQNLIER